jgi:hypothetical protein
MVDINTAAVISATSDIVCYCTTAIPTAWRVDQFCVQKTFAVPAGTTTFYGLLENTMADDARATLVVNSSMSAIFTPMLY